MTKIWIGGIFIKNKGYEIILKSLDHYKKRLKSMGDSPELKDAAAMFASVLQQEAMKTYPKINQVIEKIRNCLANKEPINELQEDLPMIEKALACYEADIIKAEDLGHKYFLNLVGNLQEARSKIENIREAQKKIYEFEG